MGCFGDPPHWRKTSILGYVENLVLSCQLKTDSLRQFIEMTRKTLRNIQSFF